MMIATVESEQKIDDLLSNKQSSKFIKIGCGLKIFYLLSYYAIFFWISYGCKIQLTTSTW